MKRNSKAIKIINPKKLKQDITVTLPIIFNNLHFHILPLKFGPGRLKILQHNVERLGGILHKPNQDPKNVSHVIVEESISEDDLSKINSCCQAFNNARFLRCSWLIRCVKTKSYNEPYSEEILNKKELPDKEVVKEISTKLAEQKVINMDLAETKHSNMTETAGCHSAETLKINVTETRAELGEFHSFNKTQDKLLSNDNCKDAALFDTDNLKLENISSQRFNNDKPTAKFNLPIDKFVCAHSSHTVPINNNSHITDELEKLSLAYENKKDTWRAVGYQKAIAAIKNYPQKIESWEEAKSIRGVGNRLADKIKEILESGQLRKVKEVCENEENRVLQLFIGVWGAGASTANNWYLQGFRTLNDLRNKASLTKHQQVGLGYYEELNERMLRPEVEEIANQVQLAAKEINRGMEITVCGSYRRGKATCGDVDILITHPDGHSHINIFRNLLNLLKENGFLTDDLVIQENNGNQQKYLGVCKLPGDTSKHRRLDIIVVPYNEYAPAIMYFTGSAHFNRSMRLLATKLGMSLSEHGLRSGIIRDAKNHVTGGTLLHTPTEESIFEFLGLKYRPPNERSH